MKPQLTGFSEFEYVTKDKIQVQKIIKSFKYERSVSEKGKQGKKMTEQRKYTCLKKV